MKTSIRKRLFEDSHNDINLFDELNAETKEIERIFFKKYKIIGLFEVYSKIRLTGIISNNINNWCEEYQKVNEITDKCK